MELTAKQRLIRAIRGEETDRVPFSPFLAYYFSFLPEEIQKKGELEYLKAMGADPLLRGVGGAFRTASRKSVRSERTEGGKRYVTISTEKGDLYLEYTYMPDADTWFLSQHPVSDLEGLYRLKSYYEDLQVTDTHEEMNDYIQKVGEDGLVVPVMGSADLKSSFQSLLETWVGTENLIYLAMDYPEEVHEVVAAMERVSGEILEAVMRCDAPFCISWEDSSTTNLNPALYEEYVAPEISGWVRRLKENDMGYIQHACGLVKDLLSPMAKQGITAVESLTPPHTGNITLEEADSILPPKVSVIGGIDPVFFLNSSLPELESYAREAIRLMKGRGFVLANSDSCPPGVAYEKFLLLAKLVRET